jgi:hypothetical protein
VKARGRAVLAVFWERKKSSQKSTRPRGAKDVVTFPGAIGRNNACVRADLQQVALGGRKRLPRVGECIVADGWLPCQRQPLRGFAVPSRGANPSTWFVGLRSVGSSWATDVSPRCRSQQCFDLPRRLAPRAPLSVPRRGAGRYGSLKDGSRRVFRELNSTGVDAMDSVNSTQYSESARSNSQAMIELMAPNETNDGAVDRVTNR